MSWLSTLSLPYLRTSNRALTLYEDRRLFHPAGKQRPGVSMTESFPLMGEVGPIDPDVWRRIHRPERRIDWRPRVLEQVKLRPFRYGFLNPGKVIICLKRKIRREVMHALGVAGEKGAKNKPHFNEYSYVRC